MTDGQRIYFFSDLWPNACAAMAWRETDRALRLDKLSEWLGRKIESIGDVGTKEDFDKVKSKCLAATRPCDVTAQVKIINQPRRRKIWRIRDTVPRAYLDALLSGPRFGGRQIEDLNDSELHQLLCTVAARANSLRRRARQSDPQDSNVPF